MFYDAAKFDAYTKVRQRMHNGGNSLKEVFRREDSDEDLHSFRKRIGRFEIAFS
jgi:hypothetical protein